MTVVSKKNHSNLARSEEKFRTIFYSSPDYISITNMEGNFLDANKLLLDRLGLTLKELQSTKYSDYLAGENLEIMKNAFKKLQNSKKVTGLVVKWITPVGKMIDCEINAVPLKENGRTTTILIIARDISERKQLETQFRQSQKLETLGRLAGGIAHDFNNMLTVINGFSDFILKDIPHDSPYREDLQEIRHAGKRAADLTRQLLAFSRKQIFDLQVLSLNDIIRNLSKMLHRIIGDNIKLVTLFDSSPGNVKVDPGQIEQIILNLAVNASDAMPRGGVITIETENVNLDSEYSYEHIPVTPGSYVLMSVSDTGLGMAKQIQRQIFEPFFTTKKAGKGTGLGLSTVYGIVKQSGGFIWVYSEPNIGTCFKIYLPSVDKYVENNSPQHHKTSDRGDETILLVEDSGSVRSVLRKTLERSGYSILEAKNGEQALRIFDQNRDDIKLLLSDIVMPGINGKELAEQISSRNSEIKYLLMSGYTDDSTILDGMLKPGVPFLRKPVISDTLIQKVREVLDGVKIDDGRWTMDDCCLEVD